MHFSLTQFRQISRNRGKKNCLVNLEPGAYEVFLTGRDGAALLKVYLDPLKNVGVRKWCGGQWVYWVWDESKAGKRGNKNDALHRDQLGCSGCMGEERSEFPRIHCAPLHALPFWMW